MKHYLLYTSDREAGGIKILGIFTSEDIAWSYYYKTHNNDERYWRVPFVECWIDNNRI